MVANPLIDPSCCLSTKRRVTFARQMDAKRDGMPGESTSTEPVCPVIANASTNRGESVVASERLECVRVVIAPLENHVALASRISLCPEGSRPAASRP
jgi:hypothetical protein